MVQLPGHALAELSNQGAGKQPRAERRQTHREFSWYNYTLARSEARKASATIAFGSSIWSDPMITLCRIEAAGASRDGVVLGYLCWLCGDTTIVVIRNHPMRAAQLWNDLQDCCLTDYAAQRDSQ